MHVFACLFIFSQDQTINICSFLFVYRYHFKANMGIHSAEYIKMSLLNEGRIEDIRAL